MMLVPTPWFLIPSGADVLGPDGRPTPAVHPQDLNQIALRCVYTADEQYTRALVILIERLGPLIPVSS